ncbi:hypothetical protein CS542_01630 [Pedobacter sp. IW39]|nr:hypothetical protein CS542_01630 [Pedobacter sp. IW39]
MINVQENHIEGFMYKNRLKVVALCYRKTYYRISEIKIPGHATAAIAAYPVRVLGEKLVPLLLASLKTPTT